MLPRTFISERFVHQSWGGSRYFGLFGGFNVGEYYWRPHHRGQLVAGIPGVREPEPPEDEQFDPDIHIPFDYWERLNFSDGMWDDGDHLVLITWMDIVIYPSWDITGTWWDRSGGVMRDRQEMNWVYPTLPPEIHKHLNLTKFHVPSTRVDALGTSTKDEMPDQSPLNYYLRGFVRGLDGLIWCYQEGGVNALTPVTMYSQMPLFAPLLPADTKAAELNAVEDAQLDQYVGMVDREDIGSLQEIGEKARKKGELIFDASQKQVNVVDPEWPRGLPPGSVYSDGKPHEPVENPSTEEIQARVDAMGLETYLRRASYWAGNEGGGGGGGGVLALSGPRALLQPGSAALTASMTLESLDMVALPCFAVMWAGRVLVGTATARGDRVPIVQNGVADMYPGQRDPKITLLPQLPVALAFDEAGGRAWALLADNTACCFDYTTGEVLAYFWLPLPYSAYYGGVNTCRITWQRDYRRLLVFGVLPENNPARTRNKFNSRIVGYSTTPLPVHVCKPIPLRPVRAGRRTPFLIRQVGSLCEPIAGMCTLAPGAGVAVDRSVVALDDSGEAHVWVTASAEGQATLTAAIEVVATWDRPYVPAPFNAGSTDAWIEGLPP